MVAPVATFPNFLRKTAFKKIRSNGFYNRSFSDVLERENEMCCPSEAPIFHPSVTTPHTARSVTTMAAVLYQISVQVCTRRY